VIIGNLEFDVIVTKYC